MLRGAALPPFGYAPGDSWKLKIKAAGFEISCVLILEIISSFKRDTKC